MPSIFTASIHTQFATAFCLVLSVTRRRPPFGQVVVWTLNHKNSNVHYSDRDKKMPEGIYAGCAGLGKNYVEWSRNGFFPIHNTSIC